MHDDVTTFWGHPTLLMILCCCDVRGASVTVVTLVVVLDTSCVLLRSFSSSGRFMSCSFDIFCIFITNKIINLFQKYNMVSHCEGSMCPAGNCVGCKDSKVWCDDPRCTPYCAECNPPEDIKRWVIALLCLVVLAGLMMILLTIIIHGGDDDEDDQSVIADEDDFVPYAAATVPSNSMYRMSAPTRRQVAAEYPSYYYQY